MTVLLSKVLRSTYCSGQGREVLCSAVYRITLQTCAGQCSIQQLASAWDSTVYEMCVDINIDR